MNLSSAIPNVEKLPGGHAALPMVSSTLYWGALRVLSGTQTACAVLPLPLWYTVPKGKALPA